MVFPHPLIPVKGILVSRDPSSEPSYIYVGNAESVSERYIELYEHIVGEKFVKESGTDLAARIEKNVTEWLAKK